MNYFIKITILISFFCSVQGHAQNSDLYNVKLKSGLVLKCELIKVVTDSFITIRQYGLVSTINYSEISSIERVGTLAKETPGVIVEVDKPVKSRMNIPDSGWSLGIQPGTCFGSTDDGFPTASILFRLSVLKGITKKWQAGFALGLDPYLNYDIMMGTVMGEGRYHLEKNKPKSIFLFSQFGYGFNTGSQDAVRDGGFHLTGGIGQSFRNRQQNIFSFMMGYRYQKAREERMVFAQPTDILRIYYHVFQRFEVKVEWRF